MCQTAVDIGGNKYESGGPILLHWHWILSAGDSSSGGEIPPQLAVETVPALQVEQLHWAASNQKTICQRSWTVLHRHGETGSFWGVSLVVKHLKLAEKQSAIRLPHTTTGSIPPALSLATLHPLHVNLPCDKDASVFLKDVRRAQVLAWASCRNCQLSARTGRTFFWVVQVFPALPVLFLFISVVSREILHSIFLENAFLHFWLLLVSHNY